MPGKVSWVVSSISGPGFQYRWTSWTGSSSPPLVLVVAVPYLLRLCQFNHLERVRGSDVPAVVASELPLSRSGRVKMFSGRSVTQRMALCCSHAMKFQLHQQLPTITYFVFIAQWCNLYLRCLPRSGLCVVLICLNPVDSNRSG